MTSRRPCWRSKQRNGGHDGGVKYSFEDQTLFLCKCILLFHYENMASCHMSKHTISTSGSKSFSKPDFVASFDSVRVEISRHLHPELLIGLWCNCLLKVAKILSLRFCNTPLKVLPIASRELRPSGASLTLGTRKEKSTPTHAYAPIK